MLGTVSCVAGTYGARLYTLIMRWVIAFPNDPDEQRRCFLLPS